MKKIYVEMIADLFHYGHVEFLRKAKALGDYLVVGVLSDEWAKQYKTEPIIKWEERARVIESCRYVDQIIMQAEPATAEWLKENDYIFAIALKNDADRTRHIETSAGYDKSREVELPYEQGISTTDIIKRVQAREKAHNDDITLIKRLFAPRWIESDWLLAEQMLSDLGQALKTHDIPYFLTFGSLLGAMRHQGVIPWDDDIDIAILERDEQRLVSLAPELNKLGYGILQFNNYKKDYTETFYKIWILNKPSAFSRKYSWPFIDIFILRSSVKNPGQCRIDPREFPFSYILPLKECQFGNLVLPAPNKAPELLTVMYGENHMSICCSANYIHREERIYDNVITRPAAQVIEAGCFLHIHESSQIILDSVPVKNDGWSLIFEGNSIKIVNGGIQLQVSNSLAAIWNMLNGTLSIREIFNQINAPRITAMNMVIDALGVLKKQGAIRFLTENADKKLVKAG